MVVIEAISDGAPLAQLPLLLITAAQILRLLTDRTLP